MSDIIGYDITPNSGSSLRKILKLRYFSFSLCNYVQPSTHIPHMYLFFSIIYPFINPFMYLTPIILMCWHKHIWQDVMDIKHGKMF